MTLEHLDIAIGFAVIMLLLSLVITTLVQTVSTGLNLRGKNLLWATEQLLRQLDPSLDTHASSIARKMLVHRSIAPTSVLHFGEQLATAIRPDEFVRILRDVARLEGRVTDDKKEKTLNAEALTALKTFLEPGSDMMRRANIIAEGLKTAPGVEESVQRALARVTMELQDLQTSVTTWFNTVMDRSSDRFIRHTRFTTVVLSVLLAFVLHIDAIRLLSRLSNDSDLRTRLVQMADTTLKRAEVLVTTQRQGGRALATVALEGLKDSIGKAGPNLGSIPATLYTRDHGLDWLRREVPDSTVFKALRASYEARFDTLTRAWIGELRASSQSIDSTLQANSLTLVPAPIPSWRSYFGTAEHPPWPNIHFLGALLSAVFLSLGAPFWFKALRQMANLRPLVAGKVQREAEAGGAK